MSTGLIGVNMSADRSLLVLFGSQSGNAEDMADQIGKAASKYNLEATVKGMDEVKIADLTNYSRILITCSTWGEGEQPDNAEDLWLDAEADDSPSMAKCNFSVLALGDSSYEFYCESGKQWDGWLESKGATRVYQRVDCDVEYEEPAASWLTEALACMGAVDDDGVFLVHRDAAGGAQVGDVNPLELHAEILGDEFAAGENGEVFHHGLASVAKTRGLHGADFQRAADAVHHERGESLALYIFGDDQDVLVGLEDLLKNREQVGYCRDLLAGDQDVWLF